MRRLNIRALRSLAVAAGLALWLCANGASADGSKSPASAADPAFASRTENPDGSVAVTVGRRLPTEWETKFGTDVHLAGPGSDVPGENLLHGATPEQSSGAVWGSITMPGVRPLGWDQTLIEARIDAGKEQGKIGATLSRSLPIDRNFSLMLQNTYSVTHQIAPTPGDSAEAVSIVPLAASAPPPAAVADTASTWATGQSVRLNIAPSGTALSASTSSSTADDLWHNKLSVEQTLFGPLKVTTSVEDAGTTASKKSIIAGFKKAW